MASLNSEASLLLNAPVKCWGGKEGWRRQIGMLLGTGKSRPSEKESALPVALGRLALVPWPVVTPNSPSNLGCIDT